ncbi:MAG: hypothetical protein NVSMB12_04290 [Acidimicrobiales bacterium]
MLAAGAMVLALFAFLPWPARAGNGADVAQLLADTNRERAANGAGPLATNDALTGVAQAWANQMAGSAHLAHNPNLVSQIDRYVTPNWEKYGENVGTGPDVETIQAAFVRSAEHHQNMIDPSFTQVGIAIAYAPNGALWVTVDFLQPMPARQPASATGATAAAPATAPAPPASGGAPAARPQAVSVLGAAHMAAAPDPEAAVPAPSTEVPTPMDAVPTPTDTGPTFNIAQLASALDLPAPFAPRGSRRLQTLLEIGDALLLAGVVGGAIRLRRA